MKKSGIMEAEFSLNEHHHLASSDILCDDAKERAEVGSPISSDLFVDIAIITANDAAVAYVHNQQSAFEKAAVVANKFIVPKGYYPFIFVAELSSDSRFPLWDTYERKYDLALAQKGPVLRKRTLRWWRSFSVGSFAGDTISGGERAVINRAAFTRIFFSRDRTQCSEDQILAFHETAYRKICKRGGTPVAIKDAGLSSYLAERDGVLMRTHGVESTNASVCMLVARSGVLFSL
jgi:hypothetical protein